MLLHFFLWIPYPFLLSLLQSSSLWSPSYQTVCLDDAVQPAGSYSSVCCQQPSPLTHLMPWLPIFISVVIYEPQNRAIAQRAEQKLALLCPHCRREDEEKLGLCSPSPHRLAAGWWSGSPARRAPDQDCLYVSTRSTATYCRKAFPKAWQSFEQAVESRIFVCSQGLY